MEFYILKSGICLTIFYGFYKLVLEKESFHVFKRFYLLVSAVLAFGIPLITFTEYIEVIPQEVPLFFPESSITNTVIEAEPINYMPIILWSIYGLGVLLFSFKFLKNLSGIIYRIKRNPKFKNQSFIHVLLQDLVIPHTFLSYIFLNKHKFETQQIPKEVLLHEETHAKQKHSLDVLFIEILQILFWFNPIIYFFKHSIKLNHEFLADQAVLRKGIEPLKYQSLLLAFSSIASEPPLANAINYSSIKKRFTVMKTQTSKKAIWLRSLILLPLLALLIYSFSEKQIVEKPFVVQQNTLANGVTETMMKEYRDFINDFESSNRIIYPKYLRAVAIYDLMTEEQRNSVKKYPENIVSNLSNVKPKTPTEAEFNSWKDSNKFAIWIDGNHVKNSELNNYKASDIKYFANSFVHNNARSEKFPQPYQNHLYTQKGFETTFTKAEKDHSDLDQIKRELEAEGSKTQQKATPEEIEEYNNIIIKLKNAKGEQIGFSELRRAGTISNKMSTEQKENTLTIPFDKFPQFPEPDLVNSIESPSKEIMDEVNNYKEKVNAYEEIINHHKKGGKIDPTNFWNLFFVSLDQYNKYLKLYKKELRFNNIDNKQKISAYYRIITYLDKDGLILLPNGWTSVDNLKEKFNSFHSIKKSDSTEIELLIQKESPKETAYKVKEYLENFGSLKTKTVENMGWKTQHEKPNTTKENLIHQSESSQQKATPEEIKEYNNLIKKFTYYKKEKQIYSLEELKRSSVLLEKMNKEQKATIDDMPVMPPSPMPPVPALSKNASKNLIEAKKKFDEKSTAYYELVNIYFSGKEIDSKKLWSLYDESMNLYNKYIDLNNKESESSKD